MSKSKKKKKAKYKRNYLKKMGLIALISLLLFYGYVSFVNGKLTMPEFKFFDFNLNNIGIPTTNNFNRESNKSRIKEQITTEDVIEIIDEVSNSKEQVKVFFIGSVNGKDFYRPVYRENTTRKSNIEYAVRCLFEGPSYKEQQRGVYSEIPQTNIIAVRELPDRVVIDLCDTFGNGGGADSIYKRMFQLIKTVNFNTDKPVYLLINGRMIETLGGEGLMLKQPLSEDSLDE